MKALNFVTVLIAMSLSVSAFAVAGRESKSSSAEAKITQFTEIIEKLKKDKMEKGERSLLDSVPDSVKKIISKMASDIASVKELAGNSKVSADGLDAYIRASVMSGDHGTKAITNLRALTESVKNGSEIAKAEAIESIELMSQLGLANRAEMPQRKGETSDQRDARVAKEAELTLALASVIPGFKNQPDGGPKDPAKNYMEFRTTFLEFSKPGLTLTASAVLDATNEKLKSNVTREKIEELCK